MNSSRIEPRIEPRIASQVEAAASILDPAVRALLVCPKCRGELEDVDGGLACRPDGLLYPVVEGVPWLVEDRARAWSP